MTTGNEPVDRVIRAFIKRRDTAVVGDLVKLTRTACTTEKTGMPGAPPCLEKEPDGAQVEVFPLATCHPFFVRSLDQARPSIFQIMSRKLYVYAAYRFDQPAGLSHGPYGITFASSLTDDKASTIYLDHDGAVVEAWLGCGTAESIVPKDGVTFLLPPKK